MNEYLKMLNQKSFNIMSFDNEQDDFSDHAPFFNFLHYYNIRINALTDTT